MFTGLIKEPHFGLDFAPAFQNGWFCPILDGEQELEAAQPLGCSQEVKGLIHNRLALPGNTVPGL